MPKEQELADIFPENMTAETPQPEAVEAVPQPEPEAVAPEVAPETPEAAQEETPPPAQPASPPPGFVPVQEVARLRQRLREMEAAQSQPEMPDVLLDPDAYNQHLASQVQDAVYTTRLQLGEELARTRYGDEVVEQALAWGVDRCDVDPVFNAEVKRARNPVAYAVEAWRKETALQRLGGVDPSEIEQFMAWKRAQAQVQAATPQPSAALAPASPQPAQPPRTLASSASAGPAAAPKVTKEQEQLARIFG